MDRLWVIVLVLALALLGSLAFAPEGPRLQQVLAASTPAED